MPDRETVIKGVHDARRYFEDREWVDKSVGVHIDALNDVLALLKEQEHRDKIYRELETDWKRLKALLKEQEAVKPKKIKGFNPPKYVYYKCVCDKCASDLIEGQPFCAGCGKKVLWDGIKVLDKEKTEGA